jgi:hypothetical protein
VGAEEDSLGVRPEAALDYHVHLWLEPGGVLRLDRHRDRPAARADLAVPPPADSSGGQQLTLT